jgi:putative glutamine amidotransferase
MAYLSQTGVQTVADVSVCELLEQWVGEQLGRGEALRRERPRIGILAASGTLRDGGWPVYGGDAPSVHAILEAGGFPYLIPALPLLEGYDPSQLFCDDHTFALLFDVLWPVIRDLDGLVFTGGGDLYACLYGQQPHPQADVWCDVWERYLARLAWLLCLPTLGICRGMQLMNVALGGTMYQDLRAQWPKERSQLLRHRARGRVSSSNWVTHPVQLARPNSRLAQAVKGRGELGRPVLDAVLSMHHQAVEALAPGLEVSATAPDGVIEAFEDRSPIRWWVATQFHPEWSTHLHWVMGLFSAFVDASRVYSAVPRGEIESLRAEVLDWLRQCDRSSSPQGVLSPLDDDEPNALITPVTKRTSPLLHPIREAV